MDKSKFIKNIPALSGFNAEFTKKLTELMEEKQAKTDDVIFSEGAPSNHLYIIEEGEAVIIKKLSEETEKVLSVIGENNIFGEMSLFSSVPRTASVKAKTKLLYYKIPTDAFKKILATDPPGTQKMLETLLFLGLGRLEQTSRELATVYEISKIIVKNLSINEFSHEIVKHLCVSVPDVDTGLLYIWNEFTEDYEPYGTYGDTQKNAVDCKHPLMAFLADKSETIILSKEDKEISDIISKEFAPMKSTLISPLVKEKLLGFIILGNSAKQADYQHRTCDLLNSVSLQLIDALENIKNQEEKSAKARLDRNTSGSVRF